MMIVSFKILKHIKYFKVVFFSNTLILFILVKCHDQYSHLIGSEKGTKSREFLILAMITFCLARGVPVNHDLRLFLICLLLLCTHFIKTDS